MKTIRVVAALMVENNKVLIAARKKKNFTRTMGIPRRKN